MDRAEGSDLGRVARDAGVRRVAEQQRDGQAEERRRSHAQLGRFS